MKAQHLAESAQTLTTAGGFRWVINLSLAGRQASLRGVYVASCGGCCSLTVSGLLVRDHRAGPSGERLSLTAVPEGATCRLKTHAVEEAEEVAGAARQLLQEMSCGGLHLVSTRR